MTENSKARPYKPSWIDLFNSWVEELPVRGWIFYLGFGLGLILIQVLFIWFEGSLAEAELLLPVITFNGLAIPYLLALVDFLDRQAVSALDTMRPVLNMTGQEYEYHEYRLSTMPFFAPLVAGLSVTLMTILIELVSVEPVRYAALEQFPVFTVAYHIIDKSSAFLIGVFIYHTIRQLRLTNSIHSDHVRINLFHLRPLQAFSRLTASTAVGLVVFVYVWMLINPELFSDPLIVGTIVLFTILAIAIFVWPLWGVHRILEMEKAKVLREIDQRFEAVFAKFNQLVHDDDYAATERLNGTIASLEIQHKRISAIPTWPWSPDTARIALTAIALPMVLMILQIFLLQAFNR